MNLIKDIESFFSGIGSSIANDPAKAAAETVKKTVALGHVASHLVEVLVNDAEITWSGLDNTPIVTLVENAAAFLAVGNYEKAALNVIYLVYQKAIEATNKAVGEVSLKANAGSVIHRIEDKIVADVKAVEGKVSEFLHHPFGGFSEASLLSSVAPSTAAPAPVPTLTEVFTPAKPNLAS